MTPRNKVIYSSSSAKVFVNVDIIRQIFTLSLIKTYVKKIPDFTKEIVM